MEIKTIAIDCGVCAAGMNKLTNERVIAEGRQAEDRPIKILGVGGYI